MNTQALRKLADENNPVLAELVREWTSKGLRDPIADTLVERRAEWWSIAGMIGYIVSGLLGWSFSPLLIPYMVRGKPWMWGLCGACIGLSIFGFAIGCVYRKHFGEYLKTCKEARKNYNRFLRAITLLEVKVAKPEIKDLVCATMELLANNCEKRRVATDILLVSAGEVAGLQSIPWRREEAAKKREQVIQDIDSLGDLTGVTKDLEYYFPTVHKGGGLAGD